MPPGAVMTGPSRDALIRHCPRPDKGTLGCRLAVKGNLWLPVTGENGIRAFGSPRPLLLLGFSVGKIFISLLIVL